jgi:hypothetical protein
MHDSRKSDGADGVIVVAASQWLGLLVFLVVIILLLGCLLPQERDKPCLQEFIVPDILMSLIFQLFDPYF